MPDASKVKTFFFSLKAVKSAKENCESSDEDSDEESEEEQSKTPQKRVSSITLFPFVLPQMSICLIF